MGPPPAITAFAVARAEAEESAARLQRRAPDQRLVLPVRVLRRQLQAVVERVAGRRGADREGDAHRRRRLVGQVAQRRLAPDEVGVRGRALVGRDDVAAGDLEPAVEDRCGRRPPGPSSTPARSGVARSSPGTPTNAIMGSACSSLKTNGSGRPCDGGVLLEGHVADRAAKVGEAHLDEAVPEPCHGRPRVVGLGRRERRLLGVRLAAAAARRPPRRSAWLTSCLISAGEGAAACTSGCRRRTRNAATNSSAPMNVFFLSTGCLALAPPGRRHGVVAAGVKGGALDEAPGREPAAPQRAVGPHRLGGVLGARRIEPAPAGRPEEDRQERGRGPLVHPDQADRGRRGSAAACGSVGCVGRAFTGSPGRSGSGRTPRRRRAPAGQTATGSPAGGPRAAGRTTGAGGPGGAGRPPSSCASPGCAGRPLRPPGSTRRSTPAAGRRRPARAVHQTVNAAAIHPRSPAGGRPGCRSGGEDAAQGASAWDPRFPRSNDGQALAALLAAGGEHLAAATGGPAGAVADFSGSFLAVRAEGGLHGFAAFKS